MEESKREKFIRLAENRMNNALKQIELLSNLSNARTYEYTKDDVDMIVKALKGAISSLEHSFRQDKKNNKFKLKWGVGYE